MKPSKAAREEAINDLRKLLKPGDTVYTALRHVSRSGMSRLIDLYVIRDNRPREISVWAALATGFHFDKKKDSIRVGGGGMDMGFHVVFTLSRALFRDKFRCIGEGCPSKDHFNGDRNYADHPHSDGGYALRHRWM